MTVRVRLMIAVAGALIGVALIGGPLVWAQSSPFPLTATATLQNAATATGNGQRLATGQFAAVSFQVTGTFVGTIALEGSVTGEHGIGIEKVDFMPEQFGADDLAVMGGVKALFDPAGRSNPCKLLPGGATCFDVFPRKQAAA